MKKKSQKDDVKLHDVMECCRAMNLWLRRNVIEGYINRMSCSQHEVRCLHKLRKMLSKYYNEPLSYFEPLDYLEKHKDDEQE